MPVGSLAKGREKTTLVFDTWANIGDGELYVHWPCDLDPDETALLRELTETLSYLGRSESWTEAELVNKLPPEDLNSFPCAPNSRLGKEYEQVSVVAPLPPQEYNEWLEATTEELFAAHPLPEGKKKPPAKLVKAREAALDPYPGDLLDCLTKDTAWWKAHGWSQPPGSQRVLYWRPSNSLQVGVPRQVHRQKVVSVTIMLLAIATPGRNKSALPHCNRTLPQAELFHRAIISKLGKGAPVDCPELTGKDHFGHTLRSQHSHAHTLPLDLDLDGHIDHIAVFAKMGLGGNAQQAIRSLRRTWTKGQAGDLQLAVVGAGDLELLRQMTAFEAGIQNFLGPPQGARSWASTTPFVPPRHLKVRGKNTLIGQVCSELVARGFPEPEKVTVRPDLTRKLRHHVCVRRRGGPPPPIKCGFGIHLLFPEPVKGPLNLGYASHYGLGMFQAINEADTQT